jgi:hypothetical protein
MQSETTTAMTVGVDVTGFSVTNVSGSHISQATSSTITLQPGNYRLEMSAGFDFSNANGYAQIVAYNHANHNALVSPTLKSSVYVYAQNLSTYLGQNSNAFVFYVNTATTICFRPTALSNVDSLTYFNVFL